MRDSRDPSLTHESANEYQDMPQAFRNAPHKPSPNVGSAELLSAGHFRAAAQIVANTLQTGTDPSDYSTIFSLLYVRLTCLSLLDYHFEAAQEAKMLQDLNGPFYRDSSTGVHLAPWELRLLVVRLQANGLGDWRRGIISYYEMARECRWHHARAKDTDAKALWQQRLSDLGLQVAQALVEMGDMDGAARHLKTLLSRREGAKDSSLRLRLGLIFLRIGDVSAAKHWLPHTNEARSEDDSAAPDILTALTAMAEGQYDTAAEQWEALLKENGEDDEGFRIMLRQNQAVCLVYSGRISEAREVLEGLVQDQNVPHGVTFNLATLFELTSENARSLKLALAQNLASRDPSSMGWEKFNADFKL